jgi:hypothetical protein
MVNFPTLDQSAFAYLIECNLALSAFAILKMFHMDSKFCTRLTKVITALKLKFPDIAEALK